MSKRIPVALLALCVMLPSLLPAAGHDDKMEKKIPDYSLMECSQVPLEHTWKIWDLFASEAEG